MYVAPLCSFIWKGTLRKDQKRFEAFQLYWEIFVHLKDSKDVADLISIREVEFEIIRIVKVLMLSLVNMLIKT